MAKGFGRWPGSAATSAPAAAGLTGFRLRHDLLFVFPKSGGCAQLNHTANFNGLLDFIFAHAKLSGFGHMMFEARLALGGNRSAKRDQFLNFFVDDFFHVKRGWFQAGLIPRSRRLLRGADKWQPGCRQPGQSLGTDGFLRLPRQPRGARGMFSRYFAEITLLGFFTALQQRIA